MRAPTAKTLLFSFALAISGATLANHLDPEKVVADCRMEGAAEGLDGADLESFVKQCVIAILEEADQPHPQK
jgi:hypothetical protein